MDLVLEELADKALNYSLEKGAQYGDIRAEDFSENQVTIENGEIESSTSRNEKGLGIRVLHSGAWGFCSIANPLSLEKVLPFVDDAIKTAVHYSQNKKNKVVLTAVPEIKKKIVYPVQKEPTIEELIKIGMECDKIIRQKDRIIKATSSMAFDKLAKYFVSSDGSKIIQEHTDVVADLVATAHESGLTQSINITEGGRGGLEKLFGNGDVIEDSKSISQKASELVDAKPVKEEKTTLVLNPDFVALLTHEILGHPSEADRVLGREMAWAGGAWWSGKIGKKIGSEQLNVFDDPSIKGSLGWYEYDDEGVQSSRTDLVKNGRLTNHLQNRETAKLFESKPTANMRATSYKYMPLIRMACTCIDKGDWSPEEIIKDTKNGFLISNMKIPSIDMKRYNWSISCQYAQRIEDGELTNLARDVIVMGTAPEFFCSIDACGNDFTVRPITNCGKGDPMQSMMMGNGGPTIRGVATVKSA